MQSTRNFENMRKIGEQHIFYLWCQILSLRYISGTDDWKSLLVDIRQYFAVQVF